MFPSKHRVVARSLVSLSLLISACFAACSASRTGEVESAGAPQARALVNIPTRGNEASLDIASWNIEWFGHTSSGPANEVLQLNNARDIIKGTDFDMWGVAEIVAHAQFEELKSQLPGYSGFLADEDSVANGSSYYGASEQKVGFIYKSSVLQLKSARVILTANESSFGGRPPLEATFEVTLNGNTADLVAIVLHAKAGADRNSYDRRLAGSHALKSYLDGTYPTQRVVVLGDFNDDVDTSITSGSTSPYVNFVGDTERYDFPTKALSDSNTSTTTGFSDAIDHHLYTNELRAQYLAGSAQVYRVDQYVTNYANTTSDHYPVLTRIAWGSLGTDAGTDSGGGGTGKVVINEVLANERGSDTAAEFIELVNIGSEAVDLSGWTLSDTASVRHVFARTTTLGAGRAITVFGGPSAIPSGSTDAVAASDGTLSLGNGGDRVILKDATGATVQAVTYPASLAGADGVSFNLSPDGTPGTYALHTTLASRASSAGKRANGTSW
ncbi:lamin tail domain-containing protein [Pendulispora rubella]|uniref:Lamin tail domain-containing protein n=1 Tax=Pendulispora rubella TaxID=2741070 RepID=A0ABZ2LKZ6_9BACT